MFQLKVVQSQGLFFPLSEMKVYLTLFFSYKILEVSLKTLNSLKFSCGCSNTGKIEMGKRR